jgi:hypothetical protein
MAIRFARQAGNWSNPLTWDGGLTTPGAGDDVYSNGFTVTLDQDINVGCLNGGTTPVGVPLSPIPNMTSNTSPSGVGQSFASSNNANAWLAFKKPIINFTNSGWQGSVVVPQQLGYQFDTPKNIQRYAWNSNSGGGNPRPRNWTFEGSNDGVSWVTLHTVTTYANLGTYFSPNISNPSSYTYYRINVSAVQGGTALYIDYLDMTESTDAISSGYGVNGQFNSSTNRTITCTGFGIIRPSLGTNLVLNIIGTSTTTNITGNIVQYYNINSGPYNGVLTIAGGNNIVNITGNVFMDSTATGGRGYVLSNNATTNTINIVGDVYQYSNSTAVNTWIITNSGIVNITGNVISYSAAGTINNQVIALANNATVSVTGNIIGPTTNIALCVYGFGTVSTLNLTGNVVCTNGFYPIWTTIFKISPSANMSIRFQDTNNANRFMYTSSQSTGQAAESNVRLGIIYGPNNDYTGTCAVPPAAAVSLGVPVDNTVGTAELTASDMWNYDLVNVNNQPGTVGYTLKKIQPKKIQPQIIMNIGNIVT